jgi:hypothetical protein
MRSVVFAAVAVSFCVPVMAMAGPIEKACLQSDRGGASRSMCNCIQQAADMTLRNGDQKRAARFFTNPDEAQRVRISDRSSDEAFWQRYKSFGETAETFCSG